MSRFWPVLVRCPRCDGRARVVLRSRDSARVSCPGCAFLHEGCFAGLHDGRVSLIEGHEGPKWWDLRRDVRRRWPEAERREYALWLRAECCGGQTLWAANEEHLEYIAEYIGAGLRERRGLSRRLPGWMKDAKHRDEVLRHLDRMRATLR